MENFDWIDSDFEKQNIPAIYEIIFPIVEKNDNGDIISYGTGLLIRENILISAGHVYANENNAYFAILDDGSELKITIIFYEYKPIKEQDGVICRDIAFFKIYHQVDHSFTLSSVFQGKESLIVTGFKNLPQDRIIFDYKKKGVFYIHDYELKLEYTVDYQKRKSILVSDLRYLSNNVSCINLLEGIKYNGLSGGPIHDDSFIYGIFVADFFIKSEYITNLLNDHPKLQNI
jgi:hypothetical protein